MSLREKVYQMFFLSPTSTRLVFDKNLINALKSGLGGVIFFTKNIQTVAQTKEIISDIVKISKITPFLGIDQEGGRVERTEKLFNGKNFLSAQYQAEGGIELVAKETNAIAKLLIDLGFNMNFAPVLDVNTNVNNPIIGERAYSNNADRVAEFGCCALKTYLANGIIPVCKHFPGHGDVDKDSHLDLPEVKCSFEELKNIHIKPFKIAIQNSAPAIMLAHLYCPCIDNEKIPASLSEKIVNFLRQDLSFDGILISDDMQMGALKEYNSVDAVIKGINAGVNLFLFRDCEDTTVAIIEEVLAIANSDKYLYKKIMESNKKILELKKIFKLL